MKKIIIPAGRMAKNALDYFGADDVYCLCDNDEKKIGCTYYNKRIISIQELKKMKNDYDIVVASIYKKDIEDQLIKEGVDNYYIYDDQYNVFKKAFYNYKDTNRISLVLDDEKNDLNKYAAYHAKNWDNNDSITVICISEYLNREKREDDLAMIFSPLLHTKLRYLLRKSNAIDLHVLYRYIDDGKIVHRPTDEYFLKDESEFDWIQNAFNTKCITSTEEFVSSVRTENEIPLFSIVEIETLNRCNSTCQFCPVNVNEPQKEKKYMDDGLLQKIIEELKSIRYTGIISLFSSNEPFLDPLMVERVKYVKTELPNAIMRMSTNGTMLPLQKFIDVIDYIDELEINNYTKDGMLNDNVKDIVDYSESHKELEYANKVRVYVRRLDDVLSNRSGDATNVQKTYHFDKYSCALPFLEMIVSPDGKVKLCSADPLCNNPLGDVSHESLIDVWYGEKYRLLRKKIMEGRMYNKRCKNCDAFMVF